MNLSVSLFNLVSCITMSAYHLRKSEVEYELKIRGVSSEGSAGELRKRLSHCLSTNVPADAAVVNNLDVETELEECEAKLSDLSSLVSDYDGNRADNEFQRLSARLWHLYYRVERIPDTASTDIEPGQRKSELLVKTKTFNDSFISTAPQNIPSTYQDSSRLTQKTTKSVETSEVGKIIASADMNVRKTQYLPLGLLPETVIDQGRAGYSTDQVPFQESRDVSSRSRSKSVPVYKWGVQFDNSPGQSIGAFLERVEELRRARGVTPQELFNSAVDLFSGSALIWYRSTQSRISSWEELCKERRIVFQAPDYDFQLQQEIFTRVQGDNESIDLFIAAMEGLYGRLASSVPEPTRLKLIMHNLHPQLQDRLALFDIKSLEDLRCLGRKAEAGRLRSLRRPPPHQNVALEPDLAYFEPHRKRSLPLVKVASAQFRNSSPTSSVSCWNCGESGHRFSNCRKERKRFCFGCGAPEMLKTNCPKCGPKNGQRRESSAPK
ncbi:uncharacterized protein LOC124363447 [Homalodisca vitripennis]|uniref:uncharacterized protein LOC124363447 n=1 Tax=Homalodisca vitripennis TaxID=197043 RepID=UPI001EEBA486|nr:uncharacterized protein LOC124363447 [Homalodisca vitripennis]